MQLHVRWVVEEGEEEDMMRSVWFVRFCVCGLWKGCFGKVSAFGIFFIVSDLFIFIPHALSTRGRDWLEHHLSNLFIGCFSVTSNITLDEDDVQIPTAIAALDT